MALTLSIIVLSVEGGAVLKRCLARLGNAGAAEVSVLAQGSGETLWKARVRAAQQAQGDVVAFLGERYLPSRGWAAAHMDAHSKGWDAAGGIVVPQASETGRLAAGLWEYGAAGSLPEHSALTLAEARLIPIANVSYPRSVLQDLGSYRNGSEFHASLFHAGKRLMMTSGGRVVYEAPPFDDYLASRRAESEEFARSIAAGEARLVRCGWALTRTALPLVLAWRHRREILRHPKLLPEYARITAAECIGEMQGFLKG